MIISLTPRVTLLLLIVGCGKVILPPEDGGTNGGIDDGFDAATNDAEPIDSGTDADVGPEQLQLSLTFTGDGQGRVASDDGLVDCTRSCSIDLARGATIRLIATPEAGSIFGDWSDQTCGAATECERTLDADTSITVRFVALYKLTILSTGSGFGRIDHEDGFCVGGCTSTHPSGTELTLRAVPAAGVHFAGWSGACSGVSITCSIRIDGPTEVTADWDVIEPQVSGGTGGHFCALGGPRSVRCWGSSIWGQLGWQSNENIGDDETVASQGDLPLGLDVVQVVAGGTHTCVLQKSGAIRCWGLNDFGQLGQGNRTTVGNEGGPAPANIPDIDLGGPALQIALGAWHTCVLMAAGTVRCWGRGSEGQLGYGSPSNIADGLTSITTPARAGDINVGAPVVGVAAGNEHSCAILESGEVKCWGTNANGQLGYDFDGTVGDGNALRPEPADVPALPLGGEPVAEIDGGLYHTCVRFASGRVRCWGANSDGELGTGDFEQVGGAAGRPLANSVDVDLAGLNAVQIGAGGKNTCARLETGSIRCWGDSQFGQSGYETTERVPSSLGNVDLGAGRRVTWMGVQSRGVCAAATDGTGGLFLCWGWGEGGGLANGATTNIGDTPGSMPPPPAPIF